MAAPPIPQPGVPPDTEFLRVAKSRKDSVFRTLLNQHREHETFRTISDPVQRELGFICACTGEDIEHRIGLARVKELAVTRLWNNIQESGRKARKKKARRALVKSKALLHKYLTKKQRWQLRGGNGFFATGKDGHTYEITAVWSNNVYRWENGERAYRFCIVADYQTPIPVFDLMLAQKVLLETNPRTFLDIAVTRDLRTAQWWPDGKHIDNPDYQRPVERPEYREQIGMLRQQTALNGDDLERQQYEETRGLAQIEQLLLHDLNLNPRGARFEDGSDRGFGFVLNSDYEVVPSFDSTITLPPLPSEGPGVLSVEDCILKLLTGVPAITYKSIAQVQAHFMAVDLCGMRVLIHPETDAQWATRERPAWTMQESVLGVIKIRDERVPKGKAWYLGEPEFIGVVAHWYDTPQVGYCLHNLDGVVIYEPPHAQEEAEAEEAQARKENREIFERSRQQAAARDEAAARLLVQR